MRPWVYAARQLWRPGRTVLTLLGIVIGLAAVVAVSLASASARDAFRSMFQQVAGRAALEVVAQGQGGFDPAAVRPVERIPAVESAVPAIVTQGALLSGRERLPVLVLGVDPERDGRVRDYQLREGSLLAAPSAGGATDHDATAALLEVDFARAQGLAVGDEVRMLTATGVTTLRVRGLLAMRGAAAFNSGAVVILPLPAAQRLFGMVGAVNTVQLVLKEGADVAAVEKQARALLPPGLAVQKPASRGDMAENTLVATETGLGAVSALALVAGAFIILNTFLMNVGERRSQLAVLRALGATRRQVTRLLLREAALLGGLGTVLGLAASVGIAVVMERALQGLVGADAPGVALRAGPFVVGVLLGPGIALTATYFPARRAGRVEPLEGLRGPGVEAGAYGGQRRLAYGGVLLSGLSAAAGVALIAGVLPMKAASPALVGLMVGGVLALPLAISPLSRMWAAVLAPMMGNESMLAFRQLRRHRTRTSLTVGVLFVAVVVAISMGNSLLNNVRDNVDWYERTVVGDFFVRGSLPDLGTSRAATMPERLLGDIQSLPGSGRVEELRFLPGTAGDRQIVVLAKSFSAERPLPLDVEQGDPQAMLRGLRGGEVVVGTALARAAGVAVGDRLTLETRHGPRAFRVAGTVTEYTAGGMALYMGWDTAKEAFGFEGVDVFMVEAAPGKTEELGTALASLADREGLMVQTMADFRQFVSGLIDSVTGFLWLLMALIFVVASLGIVNTLTVNVLEQTRELGLLRAVAMTRGQVRRMILTQALALGLVSLGPGVIMGLAVAYLLNRATAVVSGAPVDFRISFTLLGGAFLVALAITQVAAYLPARRAARLEVVEALQYE